MAGYRREFLYYLSNILQPKYYKMKCILKVNYLFYNFNFYVGLELISNERFKIGDYYWRYNDLLARYEGWGCKNTL